MSICAWTGHTPSPSETGLMYLICAGARGPLQACGPGYQALPPSGMQVLHETCFSDPAVRTIRNIPRDHLHLMWCQVHCRAISFIFYLYHMQNTHCYQPPSSTFLASLIIIFNWHLSIKKNGCWCRACCLNSREMFTTISWHFSQEQQPRWWRQTQFHHLAWNNIWSPS